MGELLNLVGLSTGVVLYAMLLAMVLRAGTTTRMLRFDPLLLVTAILGLIWNLCALPAYELPKVGIPGPFPVLVAVGFTALGFLPAVVVHSVLRGEREGVRGPLKLSIATMAYGGSVIAGILHLGAVRAGWPVPSAAGMRVLTYAFVALIVPLAAVTRRQPGGRRALWAAALAIFAVSALHLSQFHQGEASWPVELLGHHASVPLALAILYQDYPFALADLFLKRALLLLSLVAVAFIAITMFAFQSGVFRDLIRVDPRQVGVLVTLAVGTALLYPALRHLTAWFVDAIVLHRPDYRSLRVAITAQVQTHDDVAAMLSDVCNLLGPALNSRAVLWQACPALRDYQASPSILSGAEARNVLQMGEPGSTTPPDSLAAVVIVPVTEPPHYVITIAELTGGRRLLSDDVTSLETIAVVVARRIDAIRMAQERYERGIREQEISRLATEAELKALRAQINPHFLFNALTTIGYLIQAAPTRAVETLMRLTTLLRSVLRSESEYTTLGRELDLIEAYLDIERARFEHRLRVTIDVPNHLKHFRLPPLLLQPLVENAVKHGIAPQLVGGQVTVYARLDGATAARSLLLGVQDTGCGSTDAVLQCGRTTGVGLRNVERRLACQYGTEASLSIRTHLGAGTTVELRLPTESRALMEGPLVGT